MRTSLILSQSTIKALIRKKDFYVFLIMLIALLGFLLLQKFGDVSGISRFIKDVGFSALWLFSLIIAVTFSARQVPEELSSKTILPLLCKPVSRFQFLFGRFLGSLLASSFAFSVFYLLFILVSISRGEGIAPSLIIQAYVLGIIFLAIVSAIALFLSLCLTYSAAVTVSLIIYFASSWLSDSLRETLLSTSGIQSILPHIIYYAMPHYEFFDLHTRLVHSWSGFPLWILLVVTIYGLIYTSIFLLLSFLKFKNKNL